MRSYFSFSLRSFPHFDEVLKLTDPIICFLSPEGILPNKTEVLGRDNLSLTSHHGPPGEDGATRQALPRCHLSAVTTNGQLPPPTARPATPWSPRSLPAPDPRHHLAAARRHPPPPRRRAASPERPERAAGADLHPPSDAPPQYPRRAQGTNPSSRPLPRRPDQDGRHAAAARLPPPRRHRPRAPRRVRARPAAPPRVPLGAPEVRRHHRRRQHGEPRPRHRLPRRPGPGRDPAAGLGAHGLAEGEPGAVVLRGGSPRRGAVAGPAGGICSAPRAAGEVGGHRGAAHGHGGAPASRRRGGRVRSGVMQGCASPIGLPVPGQMGHRDLRHVIHSKLLRFLCNFGSMLWKCVELELFHAIDRYIAGRTSVEFGILHFSTLDVVVLNWCSARSVELNSVFTKVIMQVHENAVQGLRKVYMHGLQQIMHWGL